MKNTNDKQYCIVKEFSSIFRFYHEEKYPEIMFTVTLLILLIYSEEFLFVLRTINVKALSLLKRFEFCFFVLIGNECFSVHRENEVLTAENDDRKVVHDEARRTSIHYELSSSDDDEEERIGGSNECVSLS